ncbi:hypothetical protein [Pseudovibrio sp. Ad37]|uniref:hypothetical protein n=1 Tax=Pseudovibrio sp. Ad37 TaxID=989422 RepID=UPI0007AE6E5B|nr:hypothetical protein [Pseudovibrio sp. Ad37]KZL15874.1 hypothetical protein PsAD37_04248 [Pseudovibrio sp. Ad37]
MPIGPTSIKDLIEGLPLLSKPSEGSPEWILDIALDAATSAAHRANEDCGGAWVVIDDGRSAFAQFLKQSGMGDRHSEGGWRLSLCQGLRVQSRIIFEEACHAFVEVMEQHGIKAWVYSYMD